MKSIRDHRLVFRCKEKIEDRRQRNIRTIIGLSKGVLIHFQLEVRVFSSKKAVRAMSVIRWITVMAQGCTPARARGVNTSKA